MIAPLIVHLVLVTEAMAPEEPTSPLTVEVVQVTAPPPPGAALRTAKLDAVPSPGVVAADAAIGAAVSNAANAIRHAERCF